jgi:murein DD-endopeptidase MepM/ murein hydrolase activator NlpD
LLEFQGYNFHPVVMLPKDYEIYDFTQGYDPNRKRDSAYGIGKYGEKRKGMYTTELFKGGRDIHVGVDIAAPAGSTVHSFFEGSVYLFGNNNQPGDYGFTLITEHWIGTQKLYALYGHLSAKSIENKVKGQKIASGEVIAWLGDKTENGGWNPHLHFQLSLETPAVCDMPGAVSDADWPQAQVKFPDPRCVLGPLY